MNLFLRRLLVLWALSLSAGLLVWMMLARELSYSEKAMIVMCALVLGVLGIRSLMPLYNFPSGVMIQPKWVTRFNDFISFLFGGAAAILVVDIMMVGGFNKTSILDDTYLSFMSVFFLLAGLPILSVYTSRLTYQTLSVNSEGIQVKDSTNSDFIRWQEIDSMHLSDEYIAVVRGGLTIPRKLQKRLKITLKSGVEHYLNEPQIKTKKEEIVKLINEHIPETLSRKWGKVLIEW